MWHSCRANDREIDRMISRTRKKERRWIDLMPDDPLQKLRVTGVVPKIVQNDEIYMEIEGQKTLIPWQDDPETMIDRFDGRALLDIIFPYNGVPPELTDDDLDIEDQCNFERYRDLILFSAKKMTASQALAYVDDKDEEILRKLECKHSRPPPGKEKQSTNQNAQIGFDYANATGANAVTVSRAKGQPKVLSEAEAVLKSTEKFLRGSDASGESDSNSSDNKATWADMVSSESEESDSVLESASALAKRYGVSKFVRKYDNDLDSRRLVKDGQKRALLKAERNSKLSRRERRRIKGIRRRTFRESPDGASARSGGYYRRGSPTYEDFRSRSRSRSRERDRRRSRRDASSDSNSGKEKEVVKEYITTITIGEAGGETSSNKPLDGSVIPSSYLRGRRRTNDDDDDNADAVGDRGKPKRGRQSRSRSNSPSKKKQKVTGVAALRASTAASSMALTAKDKRGNTTAPQATDQGGETAKLTPMEKLKLKRQKLLDKQIKKDVEEQQQKQAEKDREEWLREMELQRASASLRAPPSRWRRRGDTRSKSRSPSRSKSRSRSRSRSPNRSPRKTSPRSPIRARSRSPRRDRSRSPRRVRSRSPRRVRSRSPRRDRSRSPRRDRSRSPRRDPSGPAKRKSSRSRSPKRESGHSSRDRRNSPQRRSPVSRTRK